MLTATSIFVPALIASIASLPNSTPVTGATLDYLNEVTKRSSNIAICSPPSIGAISTPEVAMSLPSTGLLIDFSEISEE